MPISVIRSLAVDDSDWFQTIGSSLRRAPETGLYRFWGASDQADGLLTIKVGNKTVMEQSHMKVISVGQLRLDEDPIAEFFVLQGQDVVVSYDEVTAGTATLACKFYNMNELQAMRELAL